MRNSLGYSWQWARAGVVRAALGLMIRTSVVGEQALLAVVAILGLTFHCSPQVTMQPATTPLAWTDVESAALAPLIELGLREDIGPGDLTTETLVPADVVGKARIVARSPGVIAGLKAVAQVLVRVDRRAVCVAQITDGSTVKRGTCVAELHGPARALLTAERTLLNILTHLSGIASLTARYVAAVQGSPAKIYDTRKTLPGWRVLHKYAVRCGGGYNQRMGLFDGVLIKDNHLAQGAAQAGATRFTPAEAVLFARERAPAGIQVEVEVDTLEQLQEVLPANPDIVLLDNMPPETLLAAVLWRNANAPRVRLEASGGINLDTISSISATGVDRISVGALTHSAPILDLGLDWAGPAERAGGAS